RRISWHPPSRIVNVDETPRIGILAVQGNVREHAAMLRTLGAEPIEVRKPEQLPDLDGLVIPGGESTAIARLVRLYGLDEAIRGLPRTGASTGGAATSCGRRCMSGHSEWSSIKHKKGAADKKRGQLFSKLARALIVAAREGGPDPAANLALANAIEKARSYSM